MNWWRNLQIKQVSDNTNTQTHYEDTHSLLPHLVVSSGKRVQSFLLLLFVVLTHVCLLSQESTTPKQEAWKIGVIAIAFFLILQTLVTVTYILKCKGKRSRFVFGKMNTFITFCHTPVVQSQMLLYMQCVYLCSQLRRPRASV